jgi:branched-subunit amino acid aminotransferase/4-amino-4-deoxychorismate lyase
LERLAAGLRAIGIAEPLKDWAAPVKKLLHRNHQPDGFLRISVSRGVGSRGYAAFPPGMPPTYAIEHLPPLAPPSAPYKLWVSSIAKPPLACLPVSHKLAQGLNSILALREAEANACDEALQLTTDGMVAECAGANIFWIRDNQMYTPSLDTGCLNGTTRDAILRLSSLPVTLKRAKLAELLQAEAVFITNTRLGVWPIAEIANQQKPFHAAHPEIIKLQAALAADHKTYTERFRARWL